MTKFMKKFLLVFTLILFNVFLITNLAEAECWCTCKISPTAANDFFRAANQNECQTNCCGGQNIQGCAATCNNLPIAEECTANPNLKGCCANPLTGQKEVDPNMASCSVNPNTPPSNGQTKNSSLTPPIDAGSFEQLIGRIIKAFLGIIGSISLLMFVYGGFILLTSQGKSDKIKTGQGTLVWASIGILVVFSSYALLNFVFKLFQ